MQNLWHYIDLEGEEKSALGIRSTILSLFWIILYSRTEHSQNEKSPWISTGVTLLTVFGWNRFAAIIFGASVPTAISTAHIRAHLLYPPSLLLSDWYPETSTEGSCPPKHEVASVKATSLQQTAHLVMECTLEHSKSKIVVLMKNEALQQSTSPGNYLSSSSHQWESWTSFQVHQKKNNCPVKTED